MKKYSRQNGFTLTPAMLILVLLMIAGTTYLLYVRNVGKTVIKLEATQIAKYSAETGIYQMKSQLGILNKIDSGNVVNEWYKAKSIDGQYIFPLKNTSNPRTAANTERKANLISIKDYNSNLLGLYRVSIEDGSLQANSKTVTGSIIEGTDRYNNKIWPSFAEKNVITRNDKKYFRYGVRVDGYAVNGNGNANLRGQSVYALLDIPQNTDVITPATSTAKNSASYLLTTNGSDDTGAVVPLNLYSNQIITGPIHTNKEFAFRWRGNFNVSYYSASTPASINDRFTVFNTRAGTTWDQTPPLVSGIVRETDDAVNQFTIFGTNFNSNNAGNWISFNNGTNWINPTSSLTNAVSPTIATKLKKITIPGYATTSGTPAAYSIIVATGTSYLRISVPVSDLATTKAITAAPPALDLDILGIMQSFKHRTVSADIVYKQVNRDGSGSGDYRFSKYTGYPSVIDWAPAGIEPTAGEEYITTYITNKNLPHQKINVYGQLTYSGNSPKLYYMHMHRAPSNSILSTFAADHNHLGNMFDMQGIDLLTARDPEDYSLDCPLVLAGWWNCNHTHEISGYSFASSYPDDRFYQWGDTNNKPSFSANNQISPILKPNNANYYTQREYVNQIFKLILDKGLPLDNTGRLDSPNKVPEDRNRGYYVGSQDFRRTYFGNDLKYSNGTAVLPAGSPLSDTTTIYVNDNPASADYMKIAATPITTEYKFYTYRQIPKNAPTLINKGNGLKDLDGGIIFVNEGKVQIGGLGGNKGSDASVMYKGASNFGSNTIIDGRLVIISYSEQKPVNYIDTNINNGITTDNAGDIVITGNVIYKNKIYKYHETNKDREYGTYEGGSRQYTPRYKVTSPDDTLTPQPSDILVTNFPWITEKDGTPSKDNSGNIVVDEQGRSKVNSLGLFASNDIKIPVGHYYQLDPGKQEKVFDPTPATNPASFQDILVIHGQLIAGHQLTQTKAGTSNADASKNDQLIMYGSFYSYNPPNLSYFDRDNPDNPLEESISRLYLHDKTLFMVPLTGTPYFPKDNTYTTDAQYISGTDFPSIVPGTWKLVTDGS